MSQPATADLSSVSGVRANMVRLAAAQALAGANAVVIYATGAIVGSQLAPDPALVTAPISFFVVGTALGTLPTGYVARRHGRRTAFIIGAAIGVVAGLLGCLAILRGSFSGFCVATTLAGVYAAVAQSFRFAATDGVSAAFRPKAMAWVLAGGLAGGVLGPQLVEHSMNLWQPYLFAVSFLGQAGLAAISLLILLGVNLPLPSAAEAAGGRALRQIATTPKFIIAALCGVVSYALMNLVMTSAPLALKLCGLSLTQSNLGIQWHVLGMYAPSFFTGSLIARFGASRIVAAGLGLTLLAACVDLSGQSVMQFWIGLVLLGVGWNFGFLGASAMIVETHTPQERTRVQSFNDFLVFGTMAVGSFSSGKLLTTYGWDVVNLVTFPPVVAALAALALAAAMARKAAA